MRTKVAALTGALVVAAMMAAPLAALCSPTRMACHKPATGCSHHVTVGADCCAMSAQTATPALVPVTPEPPLPIIGAALPLSLASLPEPAALFHVHASPPRAALLDLPTLLSTLLI